MAEAPAHGPAPPPLTEAVIERWALAYLERFASSSANLRRLLLRKAARRADGEALAEASRQVAALIARYLTSGLLDDRAYARQSLASLRRRGGSRRAIRARLAQKGVAGETIAAALAAEDGDGELAAACTLARRRRLGAYRARLPTEIERRRDLAALARAGFSLEVARRVLAADRDALERAARGEEEG